MQKKEIEGMVFFSFALFFLILTLSYFFYWQSNAHECYCRTEDNTYIIITPKTCEDICTSLGAEVTNKTIYETKINNSKSIFKWE